MDTKNQIVEIIKSGVLELEPVCIQSLVSKTMEAQRETRAFTAESDTFLICKQSPSDDNQDGVDSEYSPTIVINRYDKEPSLYCSYTSFLDPTWRKLAHDMSWLVPDTLDMVIKEWYPRATLREWLKKEPIYLEDGIPDLYVGLSSKMYEKVISSGIEAKDFSAVYESDNDDEINSGMFFYGDTDEMLKSEISKALTHIFDEEIDELDDQEVFILSVESNMAMAYEQIIELCEADGSRDGCVLKVDVSKLKTENMEGLDYDMDFNDYRFGLVKNGFVLYSGNIDASSLSLYSKHKVENVPSPELRIVDQDI